MHVAQAGEQTELAQAAKIAMFLDGQRGHLAVVVQAQHDVVGEQPVVPAPALERDTEVGRSQRGAAQQSVAAPGQAAREPAQRLVVQLLHRRAAEQLELCSGDAGFGPPQQRRRNLCPLQGIGRVGAITLEAAHHRLHEGNGRGGLTRGWPNCVGTGFGHHSQFGPCWHDMQPIWRQRRGLCA
jgi:hypothetical protein